MRVVGRRLQRADKGGVAREAEARRKCLAGPFTARASFDPW